MSAPDFVCISCERNVDRRWWDARNRNRSIPPLCQYCEGEATSRVGHPKYGTFADRRNAMRLAAMAEVLRCKAAHMEWSTKYVAP